MGKTSGTLALIKTEHKIALFLKKTKPTSLPCTVKKEKEKRDRKTKEKKKSQSHLTISLMKK